MTVSSRCPFLIRYAISLPIMETIAIRGVGQNNSLNKECDSFCRGALHWAARPLFYIAIARPCSSPNFMRLVVFHVQQTFALDRALRESRHIPLHHPLRRRKLHLTCSIKPVELIAVSLPPSFGTPLQHHPSAFKSALAAPSSSMRSACCSLKRVFWPSISRRSSSSVGK